MAHNVEDGGQYLLLYTSKKLGGTTLVCIGGVPMLELRLLFVEVLNSII